jgi:hypothetical protein
MRKVRSHRLETSTHVENVSKYETARAVRSPAYFASRGTSTALVILETR